MDVVMKVLNWILDNIGTLGMFILTLFYVGYTKKMMESSNKAVKQGELTLRESKKPEVVVYFDIENIFQTHFYIKNVGKTSAVNVKFEINKISGIDLPNLNNFKALSDGMTTLAPDQKLKTFVEMSFNLRDENDKYPIVEILVSYEDKDGHAYQDSYRLDINMFSGAQRMEEKGLHDIAEELKKIGKKIK